MAISYNALTSPVTQHVQEFLSTGTFTVPSNCSTVSLFLIGGGGGGGGSSCSTNTNGYGGGGGGGGLFGEKLITVTPGQTYTVTIGAGGTGATSGNNASNGGNTTFGSLATAYGGGYGGSHQDASTQYAGGVGGNNGADAVNGGSVSLSGGAGGTGPANSGIFASGSLGSGGSSPSQINGNPSVAGVAYTTQVWDVNTGGRSTPDGYGQGGGTTITYPTRYVYRGSGYAAIWNYSSGSATNSIQNSTPNTGAGGQGAYCRNSGSYFYGAGGGSGYARVTYWS